MRISHIIVIGKALFSQNYRKSQRINAFKRLNMQCWNYLLFSFDFGVKHRKLIVWCFKRHKIFPVLHFILHKSNYEVFSDNFWHFLSFFPCQRNWSPIWGLLWRNQLKSSLRILALSYFGYRHSCHLKFLFEKFQI